MSGKKLIVGDGKSSAVGKPTSLRIKPWAFGNYRGGTTTTTLYRPGDFWLGTGNLRCCWAGLRFVGRGTVGKEEGFA